MEMVYYIDIPHSQSQQEYFLHQNPDSEVATH